MKTNLKLVVCALLAIALVALFSWRAEVTIDDNAFVELSRTGTLREIERAINAGANVNAIDEHNRMPLKQAAGRNDALEVIALLIENGANAHEHRYR